MSELSSIATKVVQGITSHLYEKVKDLSVNNLSVKDLSDDERHLFIQNINQIIDKNIENAFTLAKSSAAALGNS